MQTITTINLFTQPKLNFNNLLICILFSKFLWYFITNDSNRIKDIFYSHPVLVLLGVYAAYSSSGSGSGDEDEPIDWDEYDKEDVIAELDKRPSKTGFREYTAHNPATGKTGNILEVNEDVKKNGGTAEVNTFPATRWWDR